MQSVNVAPNTADFLKEGYFALAPKRARSAAIQILAVPFVMAAEAWLTQQSLILPILMLEVLFCAFFAVTELKRRRENARRNALAVLWLNGGLLIVAGGIAGNPLMVFCAAFFTLATTLLLLRYSNGRRSFLASWMLFAFSATIALAMPSYGHFRVENAAKAWHEQDNEAAMASLQGIEAMLWLKGAAPLERAMIRTRKAEIAYKLGDYQEAEQYLEGFEARAKSLPAPIEPGDSATKLRQSLAFVFYENAILRLRAALYTQRRYGHAPALPSPLLGTYTAYPSDDLGWARGFLDQGREAK